MYFGHKLNEFLPGKSVLKMSSKTTTILQKDQQRRGLFCPLILASAVFLFACAHVVKPEPAQLAVELPETYSLYEDAAPAPDRWWEDFDSKELNTLISDTLRGSPTLRISLARLEKSRALAVQTGADKMPDLTLNAGVSETRRKNNDQITNSSSRDISLVSTYEIDFWGRVAAKHRSALLEMEASQEDLYTAALTLASEVTLKWLETISVKQQLALLKIQLKTNNTILELMELRYLKGFATALDIYQQRQVIAETVAAFPALEARLQTLSHELAVIAGKPPRTDLGLTAAGFPVIGALPGLGVPADLLARRPDVRAAGLELRAAQGQVAAARAGRLPTVTLSATAGFGADSFTDLLDSWFSSLAANLTYSLFNSGALGAEVDKQKSNVDERLAIYEDAVLTAIREVEDAMVREQKQTQYIVALDEQLAIAKDSFREAQQRYRKGLIDYLPALNALIATQRFERTVVQARLERLNQRVKLYRALGGGWMSQQFE
jgi:multidrug efflux system outer membrane protein